MPSNVKTHPLISIRQDATVQDAARLMADCSIAAIGVLGPDKRFVGIVTERDLAWFVAQARDAAGTTVAEIVNDFPVVVEGPIGDAAALERMRMARVRHLVVRENDDFRILSIRDFLGAEPPGKGVLTAGDVMSAPAVACPSEALLEEIAETFADEDVSGMPVVDGSSRVVGVITERDLSQALGHPMVRLAVHRQKHGPFMRELRDDPVHKRRAVDMMSSPAVTVTPATELDEVARLMRLHGFNRVPVVDGDRLVGVVTRDDVFRAVDLLVSVGTEPRMATADLELGGRLVSTGGAP